MQAQPALHLDIPFPMALPSQKATNVEACLGSGAAPEVLVMGTHEDRQGLTPGRELAG